jgi:hypothetical protein
VDTIVGSIQESRTHEERGINERIRYMIDAEKDVVLELDQECEDIQELRNIIATKLTSVGALQHEVLNSLVNEESEQFASFDRWRAELGEPLFTGVLPLEQPEAAKRGAADVSRYEVLLFLYMRIRAMKLICPNLILLRGLSAATGSGLLVYSVEQRP